MGDVSCLEVIEFLYMKPTPEDVYQLMSSQTKRERNQRIVLEAALISKSNLAESSMSILRRENSCAMSDGVRTAAVGLVMHCPDVPAGNFQLLPLWSCCRIFSTALKMPVDRGLPTGHGEDDQPFLLPLSMWSRQCTP